MVKGSVFRDGPGGLECRCVSCDDWLPYWGAAVIKIGKLIRIDNPRFGLPMATGGLDTRETITLPKIRNGYGCPACAHEFEDYVRSCPRGRTPWIPHMDEGDKWLFSADRPIPAVMARGRVLGAGKR